MAERREVIAVYAAGLVQGLALVTFPAASAVFTSPEAYSLSSTEYGGIFIPQAVMAIAASLLAAGLGRRLGTKRIYLFGLSANLLSMGALVASRFVMRDHVLAYAVLLLATASLGVGFGFSVPALNTLAADFFPRKIDNAILALNALLGWGTTLAPVFIALFVGLGIWWGLPLLVALLLIALILVSLNQPLREEHTALSPPKSKHQIPARFWIFAAFVLVYGVCETANGNWASLYLTTNFHASPFIASLALALFWSMVTMGRILSASLARWFPARLIVRILPFVVMAAFLASAAMPKTNPNLGVLTFALAGLGCSALLPLAISFGQRELVGISASVAGGLIAFYQIGYGLAAFGLGPLQARAAVPLNTIYVGAAAAALAMAALSFPISRKEPGSAE